MAVRGSGELGCLGTGLRLDLNLQRWTQGIMSVGPHTSLECSSTPP